MITKYEYTIWVFILFIFRLVWRRRKFATVRKIQKHNGGDNWNSVTLQVSLWQLNDFQEKGYQSVLFTKGQKA